jgi:hypothetical protein
MTSVTWLTRAAGVLLVAAVPGLRALGDAVPIVPFPGQITVAAPAIGSVEVADLNGDGVLDLVVRGGSPQGMFSQLGTGDGSFGALQALPAPALSASFQIGDMNSDGKPDLVVASYLAQQVSVLPGAGNGGFDSGTPLNLGTSVINFDLGDVDEDGDLDVAVSLPLLDQVAVLAGHANGTLTPWLVLPSVDIPAGIHLADMTGDAHLDLLVLPAQGSTSVAGQVLPGAGDGSFGAPLLFPFAFWDLLHAPADVDGDGLLDLVETDAFAGTLFVRRNTGAGSFAPPVSVACGPDPLRVASGDLDGDGRQDLVVTDETAPIAHVLMSLPDDSFGSSVLAVTHQTRGLEMADFTGDGRPDLLVVSDQDREILVRPGLGDGRFDGASLLGSETLPISHQSLVDLNGDGRLDVVACLAAADAVAVLLQAEAGADVPSSAPPTAPVMGAAALTSVGDNPRQLAVGDVDLDGLPDVVTSNGSGTITVLHSAGDGTWSLVQNFPAGPSPDALAIGDVTGDGLPDVVVAERFSGQIAVLRGTGSGAFASPGLHSSGGDVPVGVAIADMNLDGRADVVVVHQNTDNVVLRLGLPAGGMGPPQSSPCFNSPSQVAVADLDADGLPDLCVGAFGGGGYLMNLGNGVLSGPIELALDPDVSFTSGQTTRIAAADFDADGGMDLAVAHGNELTTLSNGQVIVPVFFETADYACFGSGADFSLGDLNGDGSIDLVAPGFNGATLLALLNRAARPWFDLGHGLPGTHPAPRLVGTGTLLAGDRVDFDVSEGPESAPATLVVGLSQLAAPFKGGLLVPSPDLLLAGFVTSASGGLSIATSWPGGVPPGTQIFLQVWIADAGAAHGVAASNALRATPF